MTTEDNGKHVINVLAISNCYFWIFCEDVYCGAVLALSLTSVCRTFFSLFVMFVIMTNCVFMAINKELPYTE